MPVIAIEVIFCPHKDFSREQPLQSWPRVPGVTVELTAKRRSGPTGPGPVGQTDERGHLGPVRLAEGTYNVHVPDAPELWSPQKTIEITPGAGQLSYIVLIPDQGYQLVPWKLTYDDPATGSGPLVGPEIQITADNGFNESFSMVSKDQIIAVAPLGNATVKFGQPFDRNKVNLWPPNETLAFFVGKAKNPQPRAVKYTPEIQLAVEPFFESKPGTKQYLEDAEVTLTLDGQELPPMKVGKGETQVLFPRLEQGTYEIAITPAAEGLTLSEPLPDLYLQYGDTPTLPVQFTQERKIFGQVETEDGKLVTQAVQLQIAGADEPIDVTAIGGKFQTFTNGGNPLTINVAPRQKLEFNEMPLVRDRKGYQVQSPQETIVTVRYKYAIKGTAIDEQGQPVPGAKIDIYDAEQHHLATIEAGLDGRFVYGVPGRADYWLAQHLAGQAPPKWDKREVRSVSDEVFLYSTRLPQADSEAATDLSAYPLLTEEVSTTGPPAPASGGLGAGGTDYGQVVDQAMRDVLGWRPSGDAAGFQAALNGVFQLRETEGHTEWTWQQRGYAVQADMGALTGAQAAIYARAKSALDQVLPLLTGLTAINPALYPPQDLEAIRTVVSTELNELVNEFALEGGPRIARVDELFKLLLGESVRSANGSVNMDPNLVQGHFGTLRDRFGLTVAYVETIDEERIVTNYRIVVEQVLALMASWTSIDRKLLSVVNAESSLGTVLIWLSRGLEAVTESVSDLTFAMDSVFVDAAQRQVIELKVGGHAPLLLSDLLDWIVRACRDEGPRMIQDSGKDGVTAFAPVLRRLLDIVRRTRDITRPGAPLPPGMRPVPDGLRTPRVRRAFQVLMSQLEEAERLAGLVRQDEVPFIVDAKVIGPSGSGSGGLMGPGASGRVGIEIQGGNFRRNATAFLAVEGRPDIPDLTTPAVFKAPNQVRAHFRNPRPGATWLVSLMNEDGTYTNEVEVQP